MSITAVNPVSGRKIKDYTEHNAQQVAEKIAQTHQAWLSWKETTHDERSRLLNNMAKVLRDRNQELAILMAEEMGKPIRQGHDEIEKCAVCCEHYARNAEHFLTDRPVNTEASKTFITFQPIGVVLAVMPWNFPFWQVFRFLAPALAAGNCGGQQPHHQQRTELHRGQTVHCRKLRPR